MAAGLWRRDERAADTKKKTSSGPAVVLTTLGIATEGSVARGWSRSRECVSELLVTRLPVVLAAKSSQLVS